MCLLHVPKDSFKAEEVLELTDVLCKQDCGEELRLQLFLQVSVYKILSILEEFGSKRDTDENKVTMRAM